jgi:hypothetical protein
MTLTIAPPTPLSAGLGEDNFSSEVDTVSEALWSEITAGFGDANLYQTWPYGVIRSGTANVSHLLLKQGSKVMAVVQARIVRIPYLGLGVAYVLWGPLWKPRNSPANVEIFRRAVRALRAEYVGRRRLIIRIVPNLFDSENPAFKGILEEEGYIFQNRAPRRSTILMNLEPSLDELQRGLHQKWRYHLNKARKQNLEIIEGEEDHFFEAFGRIFCEMVDRKQLVNFTGPDQCRKAQTKLLPHEKARVFLCKIEGEVCAGGICSALGDTGIYLFGATSNRGIKTYASYLTHWRMLEWIKGQGCRWYDLNGVNSDKNPGGFQFKSQLAGVDGCVVQLLGQFDAYPSAAMKTLVPMADRFMARLRGGRAFLGRLLGNA